jgi:hypothetical protein
MVKSLKSSNSKKSNKKSNKKSKKLQFPNIPNSDRPYNFKCSISNRNFANELYDYFNELKLNPKHNMINFESKKYKNVTVFYFKSFKYDNYNLDPEWKDIKCDKIILKNQSKSAFFVSKTNCRNMRTNKLDPESLGYYKVYVGGGGKRSAYNNLYDLIEAIQGRFKKSLKAYNYIKLFDYLQKQRDALEKKFNKKINLINHNLDVKTLHFKFI